MTKYIRNPRIIERYEDNGECFLFDPITARFRRLNQMGGEIWHFLGEADNVDDITQGIMKKYKGASYEKVCQDVETLLERLTNSNLAQQI